MSCVLYAKMDEVFSEKNKTLKKKNWKKYWKSRGILSVLVGTVTVQKVEIPKFHVSVLTSPCVVPCRLGGVRLLMYAVRDEYIIPYVKP